MPVSDQGVTLDRYMLIPRVLVFLTREESVLLLRGAPGKRLWAGRYNGIGGHVEPGEDMLTAARRELQEEAGLTADLWLCGTVVVETGDNPGIGIHVFKGQPTEGEPRASTEGELEWVPFADIHRLPLVEDLPVLLKRIRGMERGDVPFHARSFYEKEKLTVVFSE
jgi:8-oxo-dGTP diphosphatase